MNRLLAPVLAGCALAGCAPSLSRVEREAELLGRLVEAYGQREYTVEHPVYRRNPLSDLHYETWTYEVQGERHAFRLECWDRFHSRRRGWVEADCRVQDLPPLDRRAPSRFAAELVAIQPALRADFACDRPGYRMTRRNADSDAFIVVRACERERTWRVRCETDDPNQARRKCRVDAGPLTEPYAGPAHPGVRYASCASAGWGVGLLEPSDGAILDGRELMAQFQAASAPYFVAGVRTLGYGRCCSTAEHAAGACIVAHVDPRARRDLVVGLLADRLRATDGARPRILVTTYDEVHPD